MALREGDPSVMAATCFFVVPLSLVKLAWRMAGNPKHRSDAEIPLQSCEIRWQKSLCTAGRHYSSLCVGFSNDMFTTCVLYYWRHAHAEIEEVTVTQVHARSCSERH